MKIYKSFLFLLFILTFLISSCDNPSWMSEDNSYYAATLEYNTQMTATHTTIVSKAVTITPTLVESEMVIDQETFTTILNSNGECELPCVLGIMPKGETNQNHISTWLQTADFINSDAITFSTESFDIYELFSAKIFYDDSVSIISLSYDVNNVSDGKVILDNIRLSTFHHTTIDENYGESIYGDANYNHLMRYYLPSSILKLYGKPDEIFFSVFQNKTNTEGNIFLGFFYEQYQTYIEYKFSVEDTTKEFEICSDQPFISLWSWFTPTEEDGSISDPYIDDILKAENYRRIDDIDGMSIDAVYNSLTAGGDSPCLSIPRIMP